MNSYYWNTHTRETRWQIDDALKPANDRTKRKSEEFQSSNLVLGEAASSGTEQPSVSADPNNTPDLLEERRVKSIKDNRAALEHYLSTFGWSGARIIPEEMLVEATEKWAKGFKHEEEDILNNFWNKCRSQLQGDKDDVQRAVDNAEQTLKEAEEAVRLAQNQADTEDNRRQLFDFLNKQTAVMREEEKAAQVAANKARAEKRDREKERQDALGNPNEPARTRPRREIKQRFVEKDGFMVLKENLVDQNARLMEFRPKRQPPSAYSLFAKDFARIMREAGEKVEFAALQRLTANRWKEMTESEKLPFIEQAKTIREQIIAEDNAAMLAAGGEQSTAFSGVNTPAPPSTQFNEEIGVEAPPTMTPVKFDMSDESTAAQPAADDAVSQVTLTNSPMPMGDISMMESASPVPTESLAGGAPTPGALSQDSAIDGGDEDVESARKGTQTPGTRGGSGSDSDSAASDEEDVDTAAAKLNGGNWTIAVLSKLPRPDVTTLIECALIAMGARSPTHENEIVKWINETQLGKALFSRVKGTVEMPGAIHRTIRRLQTKRQLEIRMGPHRSHFYVIGEERLEFIATNDSLAKIKRQRRDGMKALAQQQHTSGDTVTKLRSDHNEEVKKAVVESSFMRWAYMVRKFDVLEPFLSDAAKGKLLRYKELLEMNNFLDLARPGLDENLEEWSRALFAARQALDFKVSGSEAPLFKEELEQPKGIRNGALRQYQCRGIAWMVRMYENGCNAVLADEMGLGKTLQTIAFLTHLKEVRNVAGPFLVIVPLSVLTNWVNEFRKWSPAMKVVKLHSSNKDERDRLKREVLTKFKEFDAVVTTYEMIVSANMRNVLTSKLWWRCVVIDEGHKIKNDGTSLSQAVRSMNCQYRLLLTGTPLQNNLHELWAMLNFLDPVVFDASEKFDGGFDLTKNIVDRELLSQAHHLLKPFCLRRTKTEVESKLPPKEEIVVNVALSEMQQFWYRRLIMADADLLARVEEQVMASASRSASPVPEGGAGEEEQGNTASMNDYKRLQCLMMQLRKCCNHPYLFAGAEPDFDGSTSEDIVTASGKLQMLDRLLKKLQEKGHRVVIFSQFTSMLDILSDYLNLRGYKHARLDGSVNRVQRAVDVLQYNQADSTHFAYLMSTRAGGLGINLATADTVILYDSDWNPQVDLQAMDRVHRIGQEKPVHVYRLVNKGTVEERIVQRAKKKLFLASMVNRGSTAQAEALEGLSKAEMLKMLKFGASAVFGGGEGEMGHTLTDAEIEKMMDRSPEAMARREEEAKNSTSAAKGDNALDFEIESAPNVSIREMYGRDFASKAGPSASGTSTTTNENENSMVEGGTPGSAPAKKRGRRKKSEILAAEAAKAASTGVDELVVDPNSMRAIAAEWRNEKGLPAPGTGKKRGVVASQVDATSSGRTVKSRFVQIDGYNVLKANTYSLEEGEKSVYDYEYANRRRGPDASTLEEINKSLGRGRQIAGRDYHNEQHCLACWDGGELILCDQCPVSAHEDCLTAEQQPTSKNRWRCPHHCCKQCDRKSAAAGGLLFRCSECMNAYCEDHLPLEDCRLQDEGRCIRYEGLGFRKPTQGYYILCSKGCQAFYQDRIVLGAEQAITRAVSRLNGTDIPPAPIPAGKSLLELELKHQTDEAKKEERRKAHAEKRKKKKDEEEAALEEQNGADEEEEEVMPAPKKRGRPPGSSAKKAKYSTE